MTKSWSQVRDEKGAPRRLNAADIERISMEHGRGVELDGAANCRCGRLWPCDTASLVAEVRLLRLHTTGRTAALEAVR